MGVCTYFSNFCFDNRTQSIIMRYATIRCVLECCTWYYFHTICPTAAPPIRFSKQNAGLYSLDSQPAGDIVMKPVVGCHYFLPNLRSPSQPESITALWPVPNYTVWWQRHTCEQLAQSRYPAAERPWMELATSRSLVRRGRHTSTLLSHKTFLKRSSCHAICISTQYRPVSVSQPQTTGFEWVRVLYHMVAYIHVTCYLFIVSHLSLIFLPALP